MAARRIRSTLNNKYTQPLKIGCLDLVIAPNADYNSIVYRNTHTPVTRKDYSIKASAKFNALTIDGVQLVAYLHRGENIASSSNCTFRIYSISTNNNWTETLLYTTPGSLVGGKFVAVATQANLGVGVSLDSEITLAIETDLFRLGNKYKSKIYINHLGVYDSILRLRADVDFLDITKLDE